MASTATRPSRSSHRLAYQSQSSPPEQRRSSKQRDDFVLDDDDEGVGDDRMPRGGEERGIAPWPPPKGGEPSPSTIDPHDTAPSSVGFSQRGGEFCPFLRTANTYSRFPWRS